jgi:hypothetical protein
VEIRSTEAFHNRNGRQRRPHEALGTTFGFSISAQNVDEFLKD